MQMNISDGSTLRDPEFTHSVKVQINGAMPNWSKLCASALDLFGLPGDRFITDSSDPGYSHMEWIFREEHDAILFRLKFGEVCM